MDYFENMLKNTGIFAVLVILVFIVSFAFIEIFNTFYEVGFSLSIFLVSHCLATLTVFGTTFVWAIRREYKIENGLM